MTFMGRYVELDGRPAVRFERVYPHPVEHVWSAVTEPDELVKWFPSAMTFVPQVRGAVEFSGDPNLADTHGSVLAWNPPRRFAFTWATDEVHLDLEAVGPAACRLTLTNVLAERDTAARNASGWTICLGELANAVDGYPSGGPHSDVNRDAFQSLYDDYCAGGMPAGAAIPSP
jgi:uncharacterized protein YndB with AHSA1/START domain